MSLLVLWLSRTLPDYLTDVLGPEHPKTIKVLEKFISMLYKANRNTRAKELKKLLRVMKEGQTHQENVS